MPNKYRAKMVSQWKTIFPSIIAALIAGVAALAGSVIAGHYQITAMKEAAIENQRATKLLIEGSIQSARITSESNLATVEYSSSKSHEGIKLANELQIQNDKAKEARNLQNEITEIASIIEGDIIARLNKINQEPISPKGAILRQSLANNAAFLMDNSDFTSNAILSLSDREPEYIFPMLKKLPSNCVHSAMEFYLHYYNIRTRLEETNHKLSLFKEEASKIYSKIRENPPLDEKEFFAMKKVLDLFPIAQNHIYRCVNSAVSRELNRALFLGYKTLADIQKNIRGNHKQQSKYLELQRKWQKSAITSE